MTLSELKEIIKSKYLHHGHYTLSSGKKSDKYFDIKSLLGNNEDSLVLLDTLWQPDDTFQSLGGLELGGALIVAMLVGRFDFQDKTACFIRKQQRIHGLKKMIEGQPKSPILLVDDVISTGNTIGEAVNTIVKEWMAKGGELPDIAGVLCVIDRRQPPNNADEVQFTSMWVQYQQKFKIYSLFKESDFD